MKQAETRFLGQKLIIVFLSLFLTQVVQASKVSARGKFSTLFRRGEVKEKETKVFTEKNKKKFEEILSANFKNSEREAVKNILNSKVYRGFLHVILLRGTQNISAEHKRIIFIMSRVLETKGSENENFNTLKDLLAHVAERPEAFLKHKKFNEMVFELERMLKEESGGSFIDARRFGQLFEYALQKTGGLALDKLKKMCKK